MRYSPLGPVLKTFGPSYRVAGIVLVLGLIFGGLAFAVAYGIHDQTAWLVFDGVAAFFSLLLWRQLVYRAWLHETGISYRKVLGSGEVRWMEVERVFFGSHDLDAHGIPLGTFSSLRLVTTYGRKITLGESIRDTDELYDAVSQKTFDALYRKAVQEFNSNREVDFGAIRVSRETGVTIRRWFHRQTIPWRDIAAFRYSPHYFVFDRVSSRFETRVVSEHVANIRALHALLTNVMRNVW